MKYIQKLKKINDYRREIMGFAAYMIMAMHLFAEMYPEISIPIITPILKRGGIGVDIFLILSGCGLFFSMKKDGRIRLFYKKRFRRLVLPWILISLPYWIFISWYESQNLICFLYNLFGISFWTQGIKTVWYPIFLVVLYCLYPIIYKLQIKYKNVLVWIIITVVILNGVIYLFFPGYYHMTEIALTRIPAFLFGSILGQAIYSNEEKCWYQIGIYFVITAIAFGGSIVLAFFFPDVADVMYRYGSCGMGVIIVIVLIICLDNYKSQVICKALSFGGSVSLEIYLIHVLLRSVVLNTGLGNEYNKIIHFFISISILIVSFLLCGLISQIKKKMNDKQKN